VSLVHLPQTNELAIEARRVYGELQAVKDLIAPLASNDELRVYSNVCLDLGLSPFAGEICLIGRFNKDAKRVTYKHQITVAGRRTIASRTNELESIEGPVWCAQDPDTKRARRDLHGSIIWEELWDEDGYPYAARALVWRKGARQPYNGTAKWSEFAQFKEAADSTGEKPLQPTWRQMPSHMLGKVAEALALRRGFPEVERAVAYTAPWPGESPSGEADDASMIAEAEAQAAVIPPGTVGARSFPSEAHPPGSSPGRSGRAPGGRPPSAARPRSSWEQVPDSVYDNEPEAQRPPYAPDDPGRPFE
jgi:RecT family